MTRGDSGARPCAGQRGAVRHLRSAHARARAREEAAEWVENALASHGTLHGAAAAVPGTLRLQGRSAVFAIPAPGAAGDRWVVRHLSRGGAMAPLLGDRFLRLGLPRPFREMEVSDDLRSIGIRTPRVVAAADYPAGFLRRGDLVTEFVPRGVELARILFQQEEKEEGARVAALTAAGALVRALGAAGVHHPDLNARNLLIEGEGGEAPRVHLIDLDRCRLSAPPPTGAPAGGRMYRRLRRSLRKWEAREGRPLSPGEWDALEAAFREGG